MTTTEPNLHAVEDERQPLTTGELLDHLDAMTGEGDTDLSAVLDHLCILVGRIAATLERAEPVLEGFAAMGEQLASGGGGLGALMGMGAGLPRAD